MKIRLFLLLTTLTAITGCSSGGTASGGNNFGLSGNWKGNMTSHQSGIGATTLYSGMLSINMVQDVAGKITGLVTVNDPETSCWTGGPLSASSLTGNSIVLAWTDQSGGSVSVQGTATGSSINGLYTSGAGGGGEVECVAHSGDFNISR
jgi:hypothetical protein